MLCPYGGGFLVGDRLFYRWAIFFMIRKNVEQHDRVSTNMGCSISRPLPLCPPADGGPLCPPASCLLPHH